MSHTPARPLAPIPPRQPGTDPRLIDLGAYYNHALDDDIHHKPGNTLAELPRGVQRLAGLPFDLRGLVQLGAARSEEITHLEYPTTVSDIPLQQTARRLHFLHASAWAIESAPVPIADYLIRYEDRTEQRITLHYRRNIWDWWSSGEETTDKPAWEGQNSRTQERGLGIRLFVLSWENPTPQCRLETLTLVSRLAGPAPFLVAVTAE